MENHEWDVVESNATITTGTRIYLIYESNNMLTQHEAQKAIKEGVARYGCQLISCEFSGNDVTIQVREPIL